MSTKTYLKCSCFTVVTHHRADTGHDVPVAVETLSAGCLHEIRKKGAAGFLPLLRVVVEVNILLLWLLGDGRWSRK